jgi:hypothetical protein
MSKANQIVEQKKEDANHTNQEHAQEEDEYEPLDEETQKKLRNLTIDENMFSDNVGNSKDNKKNTAKNNKKNKKGLDFLEYAKSNGIDIKIQYDDGQTNNYKNNKWKFNNNNNKKFINNRMNVDNKINEMPQINDISENNEKKEINSGLPVEKEFKNNSRPFNKKFNTNLKKFNNQGNNLQYQHYQMNNENTQVFNNNLNKLNGNKFDSFNKNYQMNQYQGMQQSAHMSQFGQMGNMQFNQYPQFSQFPQQMPNPNFYSNMQIPPQLMYQQHLMNAYNKQMQFYNFPPQENEINPDQSLLESLEYYFSEDNLNKDFYIRSKFDEDGYLEVNEIIGFNKMKSKSISAEKIGEVLQNCRSNVIEAKTTNGLLFIRNKLWDEFKDKLIPLEILQQNKFNKRIFSQNMNQMSMPNYFGEPVFQQQNLEMMGNHSMGYPMNMNMPMMNNKFEMGMFSNNMGLYADPSNN